MSGIADRRIEERIVERLMTGPTPVCELIESLRARDPDVLRGQEGALHGVLHRLVLERVIRPVGHAADGGSIYASASHDAPEVASLAPPREAPPPAPRTAVRLALRLGRAARDPADRGRVVADVLAHHASLVAAKATSRFGKWQLAKRLLARADHRRPLLAVAENGWERVRRFFMLEGVSLLMTGVTLALLWLFVAEFRVIPSHSMEPTLRPGDRVVVRKFGGRDLPERWAIVVFRGARDVVVKRTAGLPGETIRIENGDLLVDGAIAVKPDAVNDAVREPALRAGPATDADWIVVPGTSPVLRRHARALFADEPRYRSEAELEPLRTPRPRCHDAYLFAQTGGPATLALEFVADDNVRPANEIAAVAWARDEAGAEQVTIRRGGFAPDGVLERVFERSAGGATAGRASIAVIDGVLRVDVPGVTVRRPLDAAKGRVRFVVGGALGEVGADRDLHYTSDQEAAYAVETPYRVPDGHLFLLGDHSSNSRDGRFREVGPVPLERLIGPVVFRVWPPNRIGPVR